MFSGSTLHLLVNRFHHSWTPRHPPFRQSLCLLSGTSVSASCSVTASRHWHWLTHGSVLSKVRRMSFSPYFEPYFCAGDTVGSLAHVSQSPCWNQICHHFPWDGGSWFFQDPLGFAQWVFQPQQLRLDRKKYEIPGNENPNERRTRIFSYRQNSLLWLVNVTKTLLIVVFVTFEVSGWQKRTVNLVLST